MGGSLLFYPHCTGMNPNGWGPLSLSLSLSLSLCSTPLPQPLQKSLYFSLSLSQSHCLFVFKFSSILCIVLGQVHLLNFIAHIHHTSTMPKAEWWRHHACFNCFGLLWDCPIPRTQIFKLQHNIYLAISCYFNISASRILWVMMKMMKFRLNPLLRTYSLVTSSCNAELSPTICPVDRPEATTEPCTRHCSANISDSSRAVTAGVWMGPHVTPEPVTRIAAKFGPSSSFLHHP